MFDYLHSWEDAAGTYHRNVPTSEVPTETIHRMIAAIETDPLVDLEGVPRDAAIERLRLEIDIRNWGLR